MDEVGFIEMVQTGNYEKSLKRLTDKIVIMNCTRLYNIFLKHGFINLRPNFFEYIKKLVKNKNIYRDVQDLIQNVIVIRKLSKSELLSFWQLLSRYSKIGCSHIYNFTYGQLQIQHKNSFCINDSNLLDEIMQKLDSINFTFHYAYDEQETIVGFEAYQIPIIIIMNCE